MFIDDTGDVTNSTTNDPVQRYASITGVIFARDYLAETFEPSFQKIVIRHFGTTEPGGAPVLHRRQKVKPPLYLLLAYAKARASDMSADEKKAVAAVAAAMKGKG